MLRMKTIFSFFLFFFIQKLYVTTCRDECLDLYCRNGFIQKKKKTKILSFIRVLVSSLVRWEVVSFFLGIRTVFKFKCPQFLVQTVFKYSWNLPRSVCVPLAQTDRIYSGKMENLTLKNRHVYG